MLSISRRDFSIELIFRTSRSSGSGGQHVNKVSTRVELIFDVAASQILTNEEKALLVSRTGRKIRKDGTIHIISQEERSQLRNKNIVIRRFMDLMEKALKPVKKRKATTVSAEEKAKRLRQKKLQSQVKDLRKTPGDQE